MSYFGNVELIKRLQKESKLEELEKNKEILKQYHVSLEYSKYIRTRATVQVQALSREEAEELACAEIDKDFPNFHDETLVDEDIDIIKCNKPKIIGIITPLQRDTQTLDMFQDMQNDSKNKSSNNTK